MAHVEIDPTKRFSKRVEHYVKYRPYYPKAILYLLREEAALSSASVIADIGSGTGNLSLLFLKNGNLVYGVEPNGEMRAAGEAALAAYANFQSVEGTAEATTLPGQSVDFVTAGQAFHWFDPNTARAEFARILKPAGWVVLVWNDWHRELSPLLRDYDALLQEYGLDYKRVRHSNVSGDEAVERFFALGGFELQVFDNFQVFDFAGLRGRLLSSSYAPMPDHPRYEAMLADLRRIFDAHQVEGEVTFEYDTKVYYGRLRM